MSIPSSVIAKAGELIELYGNQLEYCGVFQGSDVYVFSFPEGKETGFPFLYLHDVISNSVKEITGFEALHILSDLKDNN